MQDLETAVPQPDSRYQLFATTRPSRTAEVVATPEQLDLRRRCEEAWAAKIGMDIDAIKAFGFTVTGSPSGTKHPHEFDDEYDDFFP